MKSKEYEKLLANGKLKLIEKYSLQNKIVKNEKGEIFIVFHALWSDNVYFIKVCEG